MRNTATLILALAVSGGVIALRTNMGAPPPGDLSPGTLEDHDGESATNLVHQLIPSSRTPPGEPDSQDSATTEDDPSTAPPTVKEPTYGDLVQTELELHAALRIEMAKAMKVKWNTGNFIFVEKTNRTMSELKDGTPIPTEVKYGGDGSIKFARLEEGEHPNIWGMMAEQKYLIRAIEKKKQESEAAVARELSFIND
jgi:hypothetical protein